jgi:RNase P/RNase MRP subunit POP5/RNase P/RNase MRP subunit p30
VIGVLPFYELRVSVSDKKSLTKFTDVASRIGLDGFAILDLKYSDIVKLNKKTKSPIKYISRCEITEKTVDKIRKELPKVRYLFELISINVTSTKLAQWCVKDNRVDILSIPASSLKEIIIPTLANVATASETFIELDLTPLLFDQKKNKSVYLRNLSRAINILLREKTPFIFSCNVSNPFMFRSKRAILSIIKGLGMPDNIYKQNIEKLNERILLNQRKLSDESVAPGVWIVKKETIKKEKKSKIESIPGIIDQLEVWKPDILTEKQLERQRYLLFEILKKEDVIISEKEFLSLFWKVFSEFFGTLNTSRSGVYLSKYNQDLSLGILRCSHKTVDLVRFAIALMSKFNDSKIIVHVMKVSGTMRNLIQITKKRNKK